MDGDILRFSTSNCLSISAQPSLYLRPGCFLVALQGKLKTRIHRFQGILKLLHGPNAVIVFAQNQLDLGVQLVQQDRLFLAPEEW